MATAMLKGVPSAAAKMRYASTLRCFGQFLDGMVLKALEIKTHNDDYLLQAWRKGPSMTMDLDKIFTPEDVRKLEAEGRAKRKPFTGSPNMLSLPQVLRLAGNYVDREHGRLLRVSWQDQSDKIQSITVQWEACMGSGGPNDAQLAVVDELCIHIYKQRKKINLASDRQGHRPFVSVGKANR